MNTTRGIRCMKFFLTLFNIICIVFALVVVAVCVMNMRAGGGAGGGAVSRGALAFLLAGGLALLAAAILGTVAALRENVKTLYTHACFFMLLVCVEVLVGAGGAAVSAWAPSPPSPLRTGFFRNLTADEDIAAHTAYWDKLQADNECCGVDGPGDYAVVSRAVPAGCCPRAAPLREGPPRRRLHAACLAEHAYFQQGCEQALAARSKVKKNAFISTAVVFVFVEIACIVLGLWMARCVRRERRKLQHNLQAHFES